MSTLNSKPSDPRFEEAAEKDECLVQVLSDALENEAVFGTKSIGLAFRYPNLGVAFINAIGRKILCPSFEGGVATDDFSFRDIVSVDVRRKFEAEVNPILQVTGKWEGDFALRDLWGGDLPVRIRMWNATVAAENRAKFLFVHCEPPSKVTFETLRGWRDRELLLALLAHSKDAVYFKDRESRFLRTSKSLIKKFGLEYPHQLIGKTDFHFFGIPHASAAYEDEREVIRTGEPVLDKEEKEVWEDGSVTWVSTSKLPLHDADGNVVGTFGISRDITKKKEQEEERKELEQRLQLAQRLESIGALAAGVAHEINTPTQFVADNVKFLSDAFSDYRAIVESCLAFVERAKGIQELDEERVRLLKGIEALDYDFLNEEVPKTLEQSSDGLRQISKIVGSMKEFSYPASPEMSKADLNHAIHTTLNISRNFWKGVAELDLELAPDLPEVECMIDEINQVLLNLIVNAAQAIEATESRTGRIKIKTRADSQNVFIEVSDTGTGMTEEVRSRIFEPFFTTKEVGQGTGQGLAMARNVVVKTHSGKLECESVYGQGTTFRVRLPIYAPRGADKTQKGKMEK